MSILQVIVRDGQTRIAQPSGKPHPGPAGGQTCDEKGGGGGGGWSVNVPRTSQGNPGPQLPPRAVTLETIVPLIVHSASFPVAKSVTVSEQALFTTTVR